MHESLATLRLFSMSPLGSSERGDSMQKMFKLIEDSRNMDPNLTTADQAFQSKKIDFLCCLLRFAVMCENIVMHFDEVSGIVFYFCIIVRSYFFYMLFNRRDFNVYVLRFQYYCQQNSSTSTHFSLLCTFLLRPSYSKWMPSFGNIPPSSRTILHLFFIG